MPLQIGQDAPKIDGLDFNDRWTLVYFYPGDFTSDCTTEACSFRDNYAELKKRVHIVGISPDSQVSHEKFKAEYHLPFELIADPDKKIINMYGANDQIFTKRSSFLINPQGKIAKIFNHVNVNLHTAEVIASLP